WRPGLTQAGLHGFTITASDGTASDSQTVEIEVANANRAPQFVPVATQFAREGAELRFMILAGDPDADDMVVAVVGDLPRGAAFNPETGQFAWIPGFNQAGSHVMTLSATDALGARAQMSFTIEVANINRPPVLS